MGGQPDRRVTVAAKPEGIGDDNHAHCATP